MNLVEGSVWTLTYRPSPKKFTGPRPIRTPAPTPYANFDSEVSTDSDGIVVFRLKKPPPASTYGFTMRAGTGMFQTRLASPPIPLLFPSPSYGALWLVWPYRPSTDRKSTRLNSS